MEEVTKTEQENVKMNLTVPKEFYELLLTNSNNDFIKPATWVKQYLMRHLLNKHKDEMNGGMKDEPRNIR